MASAWSQFLTQVEAARKKLKFEADEECFYRGHGDSNWPLLPTFLRHCANANITRANKVRDLEAALYFEFRARAQVLQPEIQSDWDVLFNMRHHAVATRLLDWTEVLSVAVYFALKGAQDKSRPCIWLLNPYLLNETSWHLRDLIAPEDLLETADDFHEYLTYYGKDPGFDWDEPVAIYPLRRNTRLHAQRGYFTIHGNNKKPLDKIVNSALQLVDLPKAAWPEALQFLEQAGINEYLLYPDLDGLSRFLHDKYEIR